MSNGFTNDNFTVDGALSSHSFDGAYSVSVPGGWVSNLGMYVYDSSGLGVTGADLTALSATNKAYVAMSSKANPGSMIKYTITADQTFTGGAGGAITGNLFGLTTGIAHADALPFYLYAVSNDAQNTIAFMVSRLPGRITSPLAAQIGKTGSAIADNQYSFYSLADITVAEYDANPCLMIGAFRMTMDASDQWTVSALATTTDGIGQFHNSSTFTQSAAQFGAAAGKYFWDNGGTAPAWNTNSITYKIDALNQLVTVYYDLQTHNTNGVGAVTAKIATPFISSQGIIAPVWYKDAASGAFQVTSITPSPAATSATFRIIGATTDALNTFWANANMAIFATMTYRIRGAA